MCRQRQVSRNRRSAGALALGLAAILALALVQGCGKHTELDPRDEEVVAAYEDRCDRRSPTVTLVVKNQGTYSMKVHVVSRSGFHRRLQPTVYGFQTERIKVNRNLMGSGGYLILEITGGGLVMSPPQPIPLSPMACDVGTLWIAPSPAMSSYAGADI